MIKLSDSSFEEYAKWYIKREICKSNETNFSETEDYVSILKERHSGKVWDGIEEYIWTIQELNKGEVESLLVLASKWTKEEKLVIDDKPRILSNAVEQAIKHDYFKSSSEKRARHIDYYEKMKGGTFDLSNEKIVIRSLFENEQNYLKEYPETECNYYLHDGIGRMLPYMTLVKLGKITFKPVVAFVAHKS
tara:strand:- start:32 stop:604 length:573 start_codon:yes stop_codon:yes gene_type:complete